MKSNFISLKLGWYIILVNNTCIDWSELESIDSIDRLVLFYMAFEREVAGKVWENEFLSLSVEFCVTFVLIEDSHRFQKVLF